jgi:hypothetical protein
MSIQPEEASAALRDIEHAERHSAALYGYRRASPHLILWGAIWIAGYGANYFRPNAWIAWLALVPIGIAASFWIDRGRAKSARQGFGWRYATTVAAIFLFIFAVLSILTPRSDEQAGAVIALLVALCYAIVGVWRGTTRMAILGFAVGALTAGGYFGLPHYFLLWMAGVGGGALILGGLWLRKV